MRILPSPERPSEFQEPELFWGAPRATCILSWARLWGLLCTVSWLGLCSSPKSLPPFWEPLPPSPTLRPPAACVTLLKHLFETIFYLKPFWRLQDEVSILCHVKTFAPIALSSHLPGPYTSIFATVPRTSLNSPHPLSSAYAIPSIWIALPCPVYLTAIRSSDLIRISEISLTSSLSNSRPASRARRTERTLALTPVLRATASRVPQFSPAPTDTETPVGADAVVAPVPHRPCAGFTVQHVFVEGVNEQRGISRKDEEDRYFLSSQKSLHEWKVQSTQKPGHSALHGVGRSLQGCPTLPEVSNPSRRHTTRTRGPLSALALLTDEPQDLGEPCPPSSPVSRISFSVSLFVNFPSPICSSLKCKQS